MPKYTTSDMMIVFSIVGYPDSMEREQRPIAKLYSVMVRDKVLMKIVRELRTP